MMLRWQQAEGRRHALDCALPMRPYELFEALCGRTVTTAWEDFPALGGKCVEPTCWDCDGEWRRREQRGQVEPRLTERVL